MHPRSPYAVSKLFAYWATVNYREAYDMFAVNGILFSHESPRRGVNFVTRKITRAVARIKLGLQDTLYLGNTAARRDWGYAPEYVEGMWRMLQADAPEDYVLATGVSASVQDFVNVAFESVELDPQKHVQIAERYFRPSEVNDHLGDPTKAKQQLGWEAATKWDDLARLMVEADIDILADELNGAKARRR